MYGGELSSRSAYRTIHSKGRGTSNQQINWKSLWHLPLPQRVLFFCQKCLNNVIQVRKFLHNKSIMGDACCPICKGSEESIPYALFLCEHARATWFDSNLVLVSQFTTPIKIKDWQISFLNLCDKPISPIPPQSKAWALALWWAL